MKSTIFALWIPLAIVFSVLCPREGAAKSSSSKFNTPLAGLPITYLFTSHLARQPRAIDHSLKNLMVCAQGAAKPDFSGAKKVVELFGEFSQHKWLWAGTERAQLTSLALATGKSAAEVMAAYNEIRGEKTIWAQEHEPSTLAVATLVAGVPAKEVVARFDELGSAMGFWGIHDQVAGLAATSLLTKTPTNQVMKRYQEIKELLGSMVSHQAIGVLTETSLLSRLPATEVVSRFRAISRGEFWAMSTSPAILTAGSIFSGASGAEAVERYKAVSQKKYGWSSGYQIALLANTSLMTGIGVDDTMSYYKAVSDEKWLWSSGEQVAILATTGITQQWCSSRSGVGPAPLTESSAAVVSGQTGKKPESRSGSSVPEGRTRGAAEAK